MNLVILGGGESGVGAAILGKTKGFDVFLSDFGTIPERYRIQLDEEGIESAKLPVSPSSKHCF